MVSEKIIVIIITIAMILSIISIVFTVSSFNSIKIPKQEIPKYSTYTIPDSATAKVSINILPSNGVEK
jgi:hypothetical protein